MTLRRTASTLLVAAVVLLAGCTTGDSGPADPTTNAPADGPAADDPATDGPSDPTTDGGPSDPAGPTTSDGPSAPASDFTGSLRSYDSFTVHYEVETTTRASGETQTMRVTGRTLVDLDARSVRQYQTMEVGDGSAVTETYAASADATAYMRYSSSGMTSYSTTTIDPDGVINPLESDQYRLFADHDYFRDAGVVNTDEGPRHRYVIDGVDALPASTRSTFGGDVTGFYVEVLVDESHGIVTDYTYEITTTDESSGRTTFAYSYSVRNIDSTVVEPPEWLDDAKSSLPSSLTGPRVVE